METIADKVAKYGKSFIADFYILIKITGIYESMNEALLNIAKRLLNEIEHFLEDTGEFSLKIIEGSFYIEGIRIKASVSDIESFTFLADELKKRSIGVLDFKSPLKAEDLISLAYSIKGCTEFPEIQSRLESKVFQGITVGGLVFLQKEEGIDLKDSQAIARRAYIKAVGALKEMDITLKGGRHFQLKKIKRALQLIVDCILSDEVYLIGFTIRQPSQNSYYFHPVHVAVFSVALGKKIGFNRIQLRTLALTAVLHDMGKVEIPLSILNKESDFSDMEMELIRRHPIEGIKILIELFGLNETSILSMLVSFEHHMKLDFSGYPTPSQQRKLNLFSRIVNLADEFDSLISGRVYERKRHSVEDALTMMSEKSGTSYDPLLMKAFAHIFV